MFKGVKLGKEKFQREPQKLPEELHVLDSWNGVYKKVVKSLRFHAALGSCTQAHGSDCTGHGLPASYIVLSWGLLKSELQHRGFVLVAAACLQLLFLRSSPFPSDGCTCTHPSDKRRQNQAITNGIINLIFSSLPAEVWEVPREEGGWDDTAGTGLLVMVCPRQLSSHTLSWPGSRGVSQVTQACAYSKSGHVVVRRTCSPLILEENKWPIQEGNWIPLNRAVLKKQDSNRQKTRGNVMKKAFIVSWQRTEMTS